MKRFLITTADERSWRRDRPVLFLGEWCRLYERRAAWQGLDAEVVPYHWDDRQKLDADYDRLQRVYEQLLQQTRVTLNAHHGTDHSLRYWRILVGPWLFQFIHMLFDRWTMVLKAAHEYEIDETVLLDIPAEHTIQPELASAGGFQDDVWNHHVFGRAIERQGLIPWQRCPAPEPVPAIAPGSRPTARRMARRAWRDGLLALWARATKQGEAMIAHTYLPLREEMKLQLALGQVPKRWTCPRVEAAVPEMARRARVQIAVDSADEFVRFAATMIAEQLPTVFLEGYGGLKRAAARLRWPSHPRVVFTSNLDWLCTVFQEYAAAKAEAGHPFLIGQHGGFVGTARRHPVEEHQVKVSDRYLTWGWSDERRSVHPGVIFTNVGKPMATWNPAGNLLLVTAVMPRYALRIYSQPVGARQSAVFVAEQIAFAHALPESIRPRVTVRIHADIDKRLRTGYVARWRDDCPGVAVDPSAVPIESAMRASRLFVYTYNSTGYLESLARNIPTLMFWNPQMFELRADAQPYFSLLERAGIYHPTPESAAARVADVWADVAAWWNTAAVQDARRTFCERYARMPAQPLRVVKDALLTVPLRTDPDLQESPS